MLVFAAETSCDETSVSILDSSKNILSHIIYSQEEHKKFGGVIPEIASRAHLQILQKISVKALEQAKIPINEIDVFCSTCGPGLIGGLLVGSIFTKALAVGSKKPFVPNNHLEGHILSPTFNNDIQYPFLCFLLTGGHTQIYLVNSIDNYELIGESLDDAVGEAFDKVSKLIGMGYPGGPEIEKLSKYGDENSISLPHPLKKNKDLNFSFSGVKTAISLIIKKQNIINNEFRYNLSASFQKKISEILENKFLLSLDYLKNKKINIKQVALVGGVAANKYIYKKIKNIAIKKQINIITPQNDMLSDNAAMIGWACLQKIKIKKIDNLFFKENPRLVI